MNYLPHRRTKLAEHALEKTELMYLRSPSRDEYYGRPAKNTEVREGGSGKYAARLVEPYHTST